MTFSPARSLVCGFNKGILQIIVCACEPCKVDMYNTLMWNAQTT